MRTRTARSGHQEGRAAVTDVFVYVHTCVDTDVFTYSFLRKSMMVESDRCMWDDNMMMAILRCVARLESHNCGTCTFLT